MLLLDEPTDNLDTAARRKLYDVLDSLRGCVLVVSHDRELLERMDRIAELDRGEIRFYGGDFSAYEGAVAAERETAERNLRNVGQLENALNAYQGPFVVVSHDERFLTEIKVERRIELAAGRLVRPKE